MKKDKKVKQLVKKCVDQVFLKGKFDQKKAEEFVKVFKKLPKLEAIHLLEEFKKQVKRKLSEGTIVVESATELGKVELGEVKKRFDKRFKIYDLRFKKNTELLGGIKVKVGDFVFDDSVNTKINEVGEAIKI